MTHRSLKSLLLGLALSAGLLSIAQAQSSSGNIIGEALVGETIVVRGVHGGFHREMKIDKEGKYNVRRVPIGVYTVTRNRADGTAESPKRIEVHAGVTVRIQ